MISRHRLRGRGRFAAVRAGGLRAATTGLRVQLVTNDVGVARVGFALVGLRSSVRRNRLRRRLREAVRPLLGKLAGHDLVLVAGAEAAAMPYAELSAAVGTTVSRVLERLESARVGSTADNGPMSPSPRPDR